MGPITDCLPPPGKRQKMAYILLPRLSELSNSTPSSTIHPAATTTSNVGRGHRVKKLKINFVDIPSDSESASVSDFSPEGSLAEATKSKSKAKAKPLRRVLSSGITCHQCHKRSGPQRLNCSKCNAPYCAPCLLRR